MFIRSAKIFALVLLGGAFASGAFGQQPATGSSSQAAPNQGQTQVATPVTNTVGPGLPGNSGLLQPAFPTPIYGLQGVLAETVEGATLAAQSVDEKFNPASSIKLATTLVALQNYGPDHRFLTSVWATGTIDKTNGTLTGDLVVSGRDPSFHYEHAVMLAKELNELGIRTVNGNLIVAPGFTMNFDWSAKHSGEEFQETFDAARRSGNATRAWLDERTLINDNQSLRSVPSVVITGEVQVGSAPPAATPLLTHKSSRLVDILKAMLCYSNNFMAERLGDALGGPQMVRAVLVDKLKLNPDEILMSSTSGLGVNRFTPRSMMKILRALRAELEKNKLTLSDILPVAGIDPGTLEDRYTDAFARGSVIAKTGTLVRTDGGASSLVGQMKTRSGRIVLFVILNQRGNVGAFRQNQDGIVTAIQNSLGGPAPFDYRPIRLSMRLADSDYENAKSRGEYEPRN
ncbi:MAG TPA: D-alanyl-D-alanine carboxypeptidase [Pyrinomonadaceae bacterium]|nr:D-alanyl-D-alanine carboxypeptidase [Pyrinomonadaceae bacterium]